MTSAPGDGVRLPDRPARPQARVNLMGALAATAVAAFVLLVPLMTEISPPHELARLFVRRGKSTLPFVFRKP